MYDNVSIHKITELYKITRRIILKGIFFDLDGTMIFSMDFWTNLNIKYLTYKNLEYKPVVSQKLKVAPVTETEKILNEVYGSDIDFSDVFEYMDKVLMKSYSEFFEIKDGVLEKLKELKENGFKMCITTATPSKYVLPLTKRLNIYDYMDHIFTPDILGVDKSDLDFFKISLKKLGTKAENTYVFDDAIYALKNAKELNLIPVGVHDKSNEHETEEIKSISSFYIRNFSEIDINKL